MFKTQDIIGILWITIGLMAIAIQAGPVDKNEIKKVQDCKTFCDRCGCIGFYCGEECICECNPEKNSGDTECIAAIQDKAKENNTPYEILIQGPSANRFLKNALQFDQNQQTCSPTEYGRTKRSTVVIYKPVTEGSNLDGFCEKPLETDVETTFNKNFREKRSIAVDSWFTDYSNTPVKPAPIPGISVNAEDIEETVEVTEKPDEDTISLEDSTEDIFMPKVRGLRKDFKNALQLGENDSIVKGIQKTFAKIGGKARKAVDNNETVKKLRGAISDFLPTTEESNQHDNNHSTKLKFLSKLKGKLLQPIVEEEFES